jgi:hypothetical protein
LARAFATLGWAVVFDVTNAADPVLGFLEVEPDIFLFKGPEALLASLPVTAVWAFVYNLSQRPRVRPEALLIYDLIDSLEVFPYDRELLETNHTWGLRYADVVTCVSRPLWRQTRVVRPDALYLPNAAEAFRFDTCGVTLELDPQWEEFFQRFSPRLALYVGSLARWFSFPLVHQLTKELPQWGFFLAGPILDRAWPWEKLWQLPNVFYAGPQPYPLLPFLLKRASLGLIPFAPGPVLQGLSPLKMYEFLAARKPIVATPFPEGEGVPGVFTAASVREFAQRMEEALAVPVSLYQAMAHFAQENTWLRRAQTVLAHLLAGQDREGSPAKFI